MEKQTATEWLFKQLWEEPKDKFTWNAILSKAKEMEKQQIMDAANKLLYHSTGPSDTAAEQYYNETFKNKEI
jgi:tRNA A37 threonylcarbamoyladenosine modification protein TsaB